MFQYSQSLVDLLYEKKRVIVKHVRPRSLSMAILAGTFSLMLAACGASTKASNVTKTPSATASSSAQSSTTVRIGWDANVMGAPLTLVKGIAAKEGVKVSLVAFQRYPDIRTAVAAGNVDVGLVDPNGTILMDSQGNKNLTIISDWAFGGDQIVLAKGSNIKSVADLQGKTIGVAQGGIGWMALLNLLQSNKVSTNKIKFINFTTPTDLVNALIKKEVSAVQLWQPFVAQLVQEGYGYTTPGINLRNADPMGDLNSVLVANSAFAKAHPDLVTKVLKASLQAAQTMQTQKSQWVNILHQFASNIPESTLQLSVQHITFTPQISVTRLNGIAQLEFQLGIAPKDMSGKLGPFIDTSFLQGSTGKSAAVLTK